MGLGCMQHLTYRFAAISELQSEFTLLEIAPGASGVREHSACAMTEGCISDSRRLMLSLGDRLARHRLVGICVGDFGASCFSPGEDLEEGIEVHHDRGELRQDACVALDIAGWLFLLSMSNR